MLKLDNGAFLKLRSEEWPCETHPPLLAAMGMRSTVNDMLIWSKAVLCAERKESQNSNASLSISHAEYSNPLK
jgi:hypothetical protein